MTKMRLLCLAAIGITAVMSFACVRGEMDDASTVRNFESPGGSGPEILFEPDAKPVALLPQPNNLMAREDDTASTGLRVNIPLQGSTDFVRQLRSRLRGLDGFANFSNLTVPFSLPLDLNTVRGDVDDSHGGEGSMIASGKAPEGSDNATIYVVNVQKDSEFYGEIVPLDLGRGFFPKDLQSPEGFFPNDESAGAKDLIFKPGNRYDFYEDETNTLLIRTMVPMRQQCKYAVVLTTGLRGEDGQPVRPPDYFDSVTFPGQENSLSDAAAILRAKRGLDPEDIAFSWEFTTMTITEPMETLRDGLYGKGPFSWMADELADPHITMLHNFSVENEGDGNDQTFNADYFGKVVTAIASIIPEAGSVPIDVIVTLDHLEYIVSGSYQTLSFLDTSDRVFHWDYKKGTIEWQPEEVTFYISVPKRSWCDAKGIQPPYPAVFYQHANIRNRLDSIIMADKLAEQCLAQIGIDAAEHGPETYIGVAVYVMEKLANTPLGVVGNLLPVAISQLILKLFYPSIDTRGMTAAQLVEVLKTKTFIGAMLHGRSVDTNHDGVLISGQSFWTADIFRTVDITRQTIFDLFEGVRLMKNLCEPHDPSGVLTQLEGDFNKDGICDVGGKDNKIYFMGMSLGSLIGVPFVALEPEVKTAVFNVPGGGLTDVLQRTTVPNVNSAIRAELTGPVVVGTLAPTGDRVLLTTNNTPTELAYGDVVFSPGARVVLTNMDGGKTAETIMDKNGNFAVAVAADEGDYMDLKVVNFATGEVLDEESWPARTFGLGVKRNTPEARSFIDTAQWAISLTDPAGYASLLYDHPLPGHPRKNFLMQLCSPDSAVPISNGVGLARAAGIMDREHENHLLAQDALNWQRVSFGNANLPIQSFSGRGWRIHPAYNHEYLLAPRFDPYSIMYSVLARRQAALFLKTDGQIIEDNLYLMVDPQYIADPIDPDFIE